MREARLGAHLDASVATADGLLPPSLSPSGTPPHRVDRAVAVEALTIAYPADRADLADLARAVRDTMRGDVLGVAKAIPVAGLNLSRATGATPDWDLALVEIGWTAANPSQAALEASGRLPVPPVNIEQALRGAVGNWLAARREQMEVIPVIHVARPVFHRAGWRLAADGTWAGLASSWRNP